MSSSTLAKYTLTTAQMRLDRAIFLLAEAADGGHITMFGHVYAELLFVRGELAALAQLVELEERLDKDSAERIQPPLRIVR